jgi:putative acetyltransferase
MIIRAERQGDEAAISAVTQAAFAPVAYSDQTEHLIVERLRKAGALAISFVADTDGKVIGHIGFSSVTMAEGEIGWYGLGPLSVSPEHQSRGVGSMLVKAGLEMLDALSANGCVVAGDPAYYQRFGFKAVDGLSTDGIPADYFMALVLHGSCPSGIVHFHPGFYGDIV